MAKPTPWKDEYTLLCEKCGYVVEGLDTNGPCPECGKPITESLPERRVGTPWQQKPGFNSLIRTWWMTLRHPKQTLDRATPTHPRWLALITIITASLVATVGWMLPVYLPSKYSQDHQTPYPIALFVASFIFAIVPFFLFLILTAIETRGLRLIGNRKGFRVTPGISKAITAHGSVGWLLCAIGLALAQLLGYALVYTMTPPLVVINESQSFSQGPPQWVYTAHIALYTLALPGFLFFECFAYLGLRRSKYANRIRPQGQTDG